MELKPTFFPSVPRIFEKIHTLVTTAGDAVGMCAKVPNEFVAFAATIRHTPRLPIGGH
jgi:long-subunit acyl-CoA synthetase (AMP-forming)